MSPVFRNSKYCFHVVVLCDRYGARNVAPFTLLDDAILAGRTLECDWFHHPAAGSRPIARRHIYVLAPQALRAVIGIPVAFYVNTAVFTNEILNRTFEHT